MRHPSESTTQFIRRRVRHWKTTLAGVAQIVCPIAIIFWPQEAQKIATLQGIVAGWGFICAADAQPAAEVKKTA